MKTLKLVVSLMLVAMSTFGQSYNPFTQNIEFSPEPTVAGFECGSSQTVQFTQGLTTATDAVLDPNDPLTVTVCLTGFDWDGATPASVVSGSYSTNFNWSFDPFAPLCIVGTQNGTLPGTGTNPLFPNPAAAGPIALALKVPATSPDGTILAVNVNLQVPAYMNATNSAPDDNESTTTQTFCSLKISGNVFDDVDGLTDTDVDGIGIDDPSATPLYANLVDPSGNVENVVPINADGTYEFLDVTPNTTYTVVLSTTQGTVGNPAPAPNLPSDWVNTGESPNNATDDGLVDGITTVVVGTMDVPLIDFGIQQPPTPGMDAETPETNPGGTTCVPVDPTLFSGADPSVGGTITELKICSCPTNATSITINGTFYDCATFPAAGVVIPTNPAGEPTQTICVDPVDGDVTVNIPYSVTDNAGAESACDGSVDLPFETIKISGNVFDDVDGLTDTDVDGTGIDDPSATPLYANLVDPAGNVEDVVPINADGTYEFLDVTPNTTYTIVLSTTQGTVGNPAPSADLPSDWVNTGESPNNATDDGLVDGVNTVVVGTMDVPLIDFGIQQPPTPGMDAETPQSNPGGTTCVPVDPTLFSGSDPSVGGIITELKICSCPTNATSITINGTLYDCATFPAAGVVIPTNPAGEPTQTICVDPVDGIVTVNIPYSVTDNAGAESACDGSVDIPFDVINISGNVYEDNNGPTNVDGVGIDDPSSTPLYANLVDPSGNVEDVVAINPDGTFEFLDVSPNTTYTVVLSTTQGTVGNPAPAASLPADWTNVSEDCCDNSGNDGMTDGVNTVVVVGSDVPEVNFGITRNYSIGNKVWDDVNQNGIFESTEAGIAGATVNLYEDANNDGVPDGAAVSTTMTDGNGLYVFNDLTSGNYIVGVVPMVPAAGNPYESSVINEANPNADGDDNDNGIVTTAGETFSGTVSLGPGSEPVNELPNNATASDAYANLTVDFGFYQPINVSGNVYLDLTGPANVDGTGIGMANATQLYASLVDPAGNVVGSVPVNSDGTYEFNDVMPNTTYTMVLSTTQGTVGNPAPMPSLPAGFSTVSEDCCDNMGNDGTPDGMTTVVVATSDVPEVNFGITEPLSLGNMVWEDVNGNGLYDTGESGIPGATVNLYQDANNDCTPDGGPIANTTTDMNGLYLFSGLDAGNYVVSVIPPTPASGGSYTSSSPDEGSPNLDVDGNDNGLTTVSLNNETYSCTVTLAAGTEPTGETPDNDLITADANENLTVDFGFIDCPPGFTFTPVEICSADVYDLTTVEPANYTGGIWTDGMNPVADATAAPSGTTYTYTYTNGTCSASGDLVIGLTIPDYTPTLAIAPSAITGASQVRVVANISEILDEPSCSPIYVFIPKDDTRFGFTWDAAATVVGGVGVNNPDWTYFSTNPIFHIWQYTGTTTFPAAGTSNFGFIGTYDPSNTDGETTFSVQIFEGSGGEVNLINNTDSENLLYFRAP